MNEEEWEKWELQEELVAKNIGVKKKEIEDLYKKAKLSISDTIAYETNQLLDRNRNNTATISGIMVFYLVIQILGVLFYIFVVAPK